MTWMPGSVGGKPATKIAARPCKNLDCLEHDYELEECLILDNSKYYKVDKNGQYRDLDFYDQEYDDLLFKDHIDSRRFDFD